VTALLNAFVGEATQAAQATGGQVEYAGDAVIAFWGAPVRTDRHAQLACQTALALLSRMEKKRAAWEKRFGRRVEARIGLATGESVVGDLGSDLKSNYTAIGEPVSRAGRLERANRLYGTHVVADARTVELASDGFAFRELDRVAIRDEPQLIFELLGRAGEVEKESEATLVAFNEGLSLYRARKFTEALAQFERNPDDPVSQLYVARCKAFCEDPPPPEWNAVGDLRRASGR
jgi:adenylate cyclase